MAQNDLTTLAAVKQYAQTTGSAGTTGDDPLLSSLITGCSQMVLNELVRPSILRSQHTDIWTGTGGQFLGTNRPLKYRPVLSVSQVLINGAVVPPVPSTNVPLGSGFTFDPWDGVPPGALQLLRLNGFGFMDNWAPNNCQATYIAGYAATEALIVPATPFRVTPNSPFGLPARDEGVVYTNTGVALVAVQSAPVLGQYVPPNPLAATSPTNYWQFAAADAAAGVSVTYSFVPSAIEIATRLWVADMYKYRARIGEKSMSEGGVQTASYNIVAIPDVVKKALDPFQNKNFLM